MDMLKDVGINEGVLINFDELELEN